LYGIFKSMYISVDMGGTNTRVAGVTNLEQLEYIGEPLRQRNSQDYQRDLDFIIESARRLAGREAIKAVGIGTPGNPAPDRLGIATAKNIPHWNGKPLVQPIAEALECPVYFDNDAVTAGLGEAYYGNGVGKDFHYLIWGTGIGGAEIRTNNSSDVNHASKVHWKKHLSDWTVDCGGKTLIEQYKQQPSDFSEERWREVMPRFQRHLLNYIVKFEPPSIVFGGGIANMKRDELVEFGARQGTEIAISAFGDDSGIPGGAGLIRFASRHNLSPFDTTDIEE
jgi:predicted NBD/HSP70 family sugar kinase